MMKSVDANAPGSPRKEVAPAKENNGPGEKVLPSTPNISGSLTVAPTKFTATTEQIDDDLIDADDEPPPINVNDVVDNRFKVINLLCLKLIPPFRMVLNRFYKYSVKVGLVLFSKWLTWNPKHKRLMH